MNASEVKKLAVSDIEQAIKTLGTLQQRVSTICDSQASHFGVIQQFHEYPSYKTVNNALPSHEHAIVNKSGAGSLEAIKAKIESFAQADLETRATNEQIRTDNLALFNKLMMILESVGLKPTVYKVTGTARNPKREWVPSDWRALLDTIPLQDTWADHSKRVTERLNYIDVMIRKRDEAIADAKNKKQAEEAKLKHKVDFEIAKRAFADKYGAEPSDSADELVRKVIAKNKYLQLAHYLQKNRDDWSDGYEYAVAGLRLFKIETPEDQEIYDNIFGFIGDEWDGDGRVFRDCKWGYPALFAKAELEDNQTYTDYQSVAAFAQR